MDENVASFMGTQAHSVERVALGQCPGKQARATHTHA